MKLFPDDISLFQLITVALTILIGVVGSTSTAILAYFQWKSNKSPNQRKENYKLLVIAINNILTIAAVSFLISIFVRNYFGAIYVKKAHDPAIFMLTAVLLLFFSMWNIFNTLKEQKT